jgi:TetR/AcrR family transcriptional regulator, transcriptional repressor for nem operon
MSRQEGDTRSKIMDLGEKLLLKKGFNGFSYADIAASLGIKNASIHYHFPGKSDLGIAIIGRARQRFGNWSTSRETAALGDWEMLDSFFQIYRHYLTRSDSVCLSGALETDFSTLPRAMQEETRGLVNDLLTWMEKFLDEGRQRRTFSFPGSPRDQAIIVLAVMQGGLQMNRVVDPAIFEQAVSQVRRLLQP